jgi:hypothetical protein
MIRKGILALRGSLSVNHKEDKKRAASPPLFPQKLQRKRDDELDLRIDSPPRTLHYGRILLLPYEEYRSLHQPSSIAVCHSTKMTTVQEEDSFFPWPPQRTAPPPSPLEVEDDLVDTPPDGEAEEFSRSKAWECPQCTLLNDLNKLWYLPRPSVAGPHFS